MDIFSTCHLFLAFYFPVFTTYWFVKLLSQFRRFTGFLSLSDTDQIIGFFWVSFSFFFKLCDVNTFHHLVSRFCSAANRPVPLRRLTHHLGCTPWGVAQLRISPWPGTPWALALPPAPETWPVSSLFPLLGGAAEEADGGERTRAPKE